MSAEKQDGATNLSRDEMVLNLEVMKILRPKTCQLENLKAQILNEIETFHQEEKNLLDSSNEVEVLQRERLLHVKAIEAIDADVSKLRTMMKHAKNDLENSKVKTQELVDLYKPMKLEVDQTRISIGLDTLPEIKDLEKIFKKRKV
ncbi:zinc finger C4H2 domain-containing protein-like [Hydractinia symbiolongicarpus]|uniref:zinc finger C4H2 domain-containing protein-like n=1 Tax=Hydractinia symbiolongicarpus TaxID=13093 RepID=UPI00254B8F84|nr:zinc finger C4H2 domain-containing protein-like [Hydractinia symbiolongicarpus]